MILQEKLHALRSRAGLTQEALAENLGVSRQAVAKWEQGVSVPDIGNLVALARAFQVTVDSLVKPEMDCGMRMLAPEKADEDALVEFLLRAKRATYAGNGGEAEEPCRPKSHDLRYVEGEFLYIDTYLGGEHFAGEEAVWLRGTPLWAMNYAGKVVSTLFEGGFLKDALARCAPDMPYRGPGVYRAGQSLYRCAVAGGMDWFSGSEDIYVGDELVYTCVFHGGIIR